MKEIFNKNNEIDAFEIGAGPGIFFKVLREKVNMNLQFASEPGKGYGEVFKHFNLDSELLITENFWEKESIKGKKFDIIFLDGVFKHVYDPEEMLLRIRQFLKPN